MTFDNTNMRSLFKTLGVSLPTTVAIYPDGNRRYGKSNGLSLEEGNQAGIKKLFEIVLILNELRVENVFIMLATKNNFAKRAAEMHEVLVNQILEVLSGKYLYLKNKGINLQFVGDTSILSFSQIAKLEQVSTNEPDPQNDKMRVYLGLNYDSASEFERANYEFGNLELTQTIDLTIQTGGGHNYPTIAAMMFSPSMQVYHLDCLWPDFAENHLEEIYSDYAHRLQEEQSQY
jgi:undecaprenyl pyrophosphate synthase